MKKKLLFIYGPLGGGAERVLIDKYIHIIKLIDYFEYFYKIKIE